MCFFSIPYNVADSTATTSCGDKLHAFEQKVFLAKPECDQNSNQNKPADPNPHLLRRLVKNVHMCPLRFPVALLRFKDGHRILKLMILAENLNVGVFFLLVFSRQILRRYGQPLSFQKRNDTAAQGALP